MRAFQITTYHLDWPALGGKIRPIVIIFERSAAMSHDAEKVVPNASKIKMPVSNNIPPIKRAKNGKRT